MTSYFFLDNKEDKIYALSIIDNLRNISPNTSNQGISTITQNDDPCRDDNDRDWELGQNLSQHFKKEHFTGTLGETIEEYFDIYEIESENYALTEQPKFRYLHNLFDEDTKRFFRTSDQNIAISYHEAGSKMENEDNSITRQSLVSQYLQSLHQNKIVEKESCNVDEALEKLLDMIAKFSPQGPKSQRTHEGKVEYPYDTVIGIDLARNALAKNYSSTPPWTFIKFYTALEPAWLQDQR